MPRKDYNNEYNNESVPFGYTVAPTAPADQPSAAGKTDGSGFGVSADFSRYTPTEPADNSAYDQGKTQVVDAIQYGEKSVQPVVGWLVGIRGTCRGKDFRLYSGRNYIGRAPENEVVLDDPQVSREPALQVAYDPRSRAFLAAPGNTHSRCLAYLNGELLMGTEKLKSYDKLMVGESSELVFVPFCGEEFDWRDSE